MEQKLERWIVLSSRGVREGEQIQMINKSKAALRLRSSSENLISLPLSMSAQNMHYAETVYWRCLKIDK